MDDDCNQGKDDYIGIQESCIGARVSVIIDEQTNHVCALSLWSLYFWSRADHYISAWTQFSILK